MKRDWNLIREILIKLEEEPEQYGNLMPADVAGYDWKIVSYHIKLLTEAGFIESKCYQPLGCEPTYIGVSLTWQGHELLNTIRNKTLWNMIKEYAREKGIELSFEAVKTIAGLIIKQVLGA